MIDARTVQTFLKTEGYYKGTVDGIFGPASLAASRAALAANKVGAGQWTNDRVWIAINQLVLNKINDAGLLVDGILGQKTNDALYIYNTTQLHTIKTNWPRQADVRAKTSMFGKPGSHNLVQLECPYPMYVDYKRRIKITRFPVHTKIKASLTRIFTRILGSYGIDQIRKLNLDINSGCYNYRPTTGSSSLSLHAWGIALDLDYPNNMMYDDGRSAAFSKPVYADMIRFFEEEGWVSLGHARNFDWAHFQAARL